MMQDDRQVQATEIIRSHMLYTMGAGIMPIPIADMLAVSALQINMIRMLAKVYDVPFEETQTKAIITSLTGSALSKIGSRVLIKFIPGIGSVLGGVAMGILSGASTYALGEAFRTHFETGGTLLDFDTSRMKRFYDEKFEKGKKVAEDLQKEQTTQKKTESEEQVVVAAQDKEDILKKLKELSDLRAAGVISEAEFEEMKKKLIAAF